MLLTGYIWILLVLALFSVFTGWAYFDNLANAIAVALAIAIIWIYRSLGREALMYTIVLVLVITLSQVFSLIVNSRSFYWLSSLMELGTLIVPIFLLPLLILPRENLNKFYYRFLWAMLAFCWLNIFGLILQHVFGSSVLPLKGEVAVQFSRNLPTGFFSNYNLLGDFFVMVMLASHMIRRLHPDYFEPVSRYLFWSCVLVIILSACKHAILCVLIYFIFSSERHKLQRAVFSVSLLVIVVAMMYWLNVYHLQTKLNMYAYAVSNLSALDTALVESRILNAVQGFSLLKQTFPIGLGLGTWGDASARFNENMLGLEFANTMSDSFVSHLIVEQGVMAIVYFAVLCYPFVKVRQGILISLSTFIVFLFTTGLNSEFWPILFSLNVLLAFDLYRRKKEDSSGQDAVSSDN